MMEKILDKIVELKGDVADMKSATSPPEPAGAGARGRTCRKANK
jgi:hypothetical protein